MKLKLVPTNIIKYNEQGHVCASLLRQTKKQYHSNLNIKTIEVNENFWKTVKSFFLTNQVVLKKHI